MNKKPLFSVIIPVKGRLNFTKEAIDSIYKQEYIDNSRVEIIVVENEEGQDIIRDKIRKSYPEVKIAINRFEDYAGGNRNSGLEVAQGKYVVFLDSDDQLHPDFLFKMSSILGKDINATAAVCFSTAIFAPGYNWQEYINWHLLMLVRDVNLILFSFFHQGYLIPSAFYLCQLSHMIFKREAIKSMKFDYKYRFGGEDWDFINRILVNGKIKIITDRLTIFRYSYNSSTVNPINKTNKWQSYLTLAYSLPVSLRKNIYYHLFLGYIKLFKGQNVSI